MQKFSNIVTILVAAFQRYEMEKRCAYEESVQEVKHGSFTPLYCPHLVVWGRQLPPLTRREKWSSHVLWLWAVVVWGFSLLCSSIGDSILDSSIAVCFMILLLLRGTCLSISTMYKILCRLETDLYFVTVFEVINKYIVSHQGNKINRLSFNSEVVMLKKLPGWHIIFAW